MAKLPQTELVAWCNHCEHYVGAEDAGTRCPNIDCDRTLRKRRGYICRDCEAHNIFFDRTAFLEHSHWDADGHLWEQA